MLPTRLKSILCHITGSAIAYSILDKLLSFKIKDYKTRSQIRSFFNCLIVVGFSAESLLKQSRKSRGIKPFSELDLNENESEPSKPNIFNSLTGMEKVVCSFVGYFVDDFFRVLKSKEYDFVFHHILGAILLSFGLAMRVDGRVFAPFGLLELSTVFLNVSQLSEHISDAVVRRRTRRASALSFLISFVSLRVVFFPLHLRSEALANERRKLGKLFHLTYLAWFLQLFWLKEIVDRVRRIE